MKRITQARLSLLKVVFVHGNLGEFANPAQSHKPVFLHRVCLAELQQICCEMCADLYDRFT
jgi:hypothetical protein